MDRLMDQIDWDEIEDAVLDYRDYCVDSVFHQPTPRQTEKHGFEATMVRIHNAVREGTRSES